MFILCSTVIYFVCFLSYVCIHMCLQVYMWRPENKFRCCSSGPLNCLFWRQDLSLVWNSPSRQGWPVSKPQRLFCLHLPSAGIMCLLLWVSLCILPAWFQTHRDHSTGIKGVHHQTWFANSLPYSLLLMSFWYWIQVLPTKLHPWLLFT